ncbi:hypothetical protein BGZ95_010677 [Linnemannia exigua]|uniref:Uncharacterized protein n=1 Tax=Linnemannia exigua TaxID=604196 RepID=A0AAD4DBI3_9FUNG|nr:hypothetical protein BGZ95_010677 [Linnemannia exigua]
MVHLDSLQIHEVSALDLDLLTDAFNSGTLPRLQSIHIAIYGAGLPEGGDADIAEMLKAGSSGWRTLEEDTYEFHEKSNISAQDLIDLDTPLDFLKSANPPAVSPPLKSWKCESTLKVFRVMVTGIPRPDVRELYFLGTIPDRNVLLESYPGQSLDLQRRVYERLARFTNLERLELGNNGFTYNPPSILSNATLTMALDHQLASDIFRENEGFTGANVTPKTETFDQTISGLRAVAE